MHQTLKTVIAASAAVWATALAQNASLPTVDLGYNVQQATTYNSTEKVYHFNNIRYAAPPVGDLRFAAPQAPEVNRTEVQTGTVERTCPAALPTWLATSEAYIPQYLAGNTTFILPNDTAPASVTPDPNATEDCLFLDVVVPQDIFEKTAVGGYGAPVLVWIYGGGYTAGSKGAFDNPIGLLARSRDNGGTGVIYVALNYRLGAFGWLGGPTFQADGGLANAALYDQRFALQWVQDNIAKFGGDPNRVTVFGESAGGGSIMHQITAFGGSAGPAPFQQAVLQSPGWQVAVSNQQQEQFFDGFLKNANVSTLAEAKALNTTQLQIANALSVTGSGYGSFVFGPSVDGVFAPSLPGQLLARGQFDKKIRVITGHNADEGLLFSPPIYPNSEAVFDAEIGQELPTSLAWNQSVIQYIADTLYPIANYSNQIARSSALIADSTFVCNTYYLQKAFRNTSYAYLFAVPPATHGSDIAYTFYNDQPSEGFNSTVANALQDYITHFAEYGYPNEAGVPYFPMYQGNATIQDLNITNITPITDAAANPKCDWWQKALYY